MRPSWDLYDNFENFMFIGINTRNSRINRTFMPLKKKLFNLLIPYAYQIKGIFILHKPQIVNTNFFLFFIMFFGLFMQFRVKIADLSIFNWNMAGVIFQKFNFFLFFWFLYIKTHVWPNFNEEIQKKGAGRTP